MTKYFVSLQSHLTHPTCARYHCPNKFKLFIYNLIRLCTCFITIIQNTRFSHSILSPPPFLSLDFSYSQKCKPHLLGMTKCIHGNLHHSYMTRWDKTPMICESAPLLSLFFGIVIPIFWHYFRMINPKVHYWWESSTVFTRLSQLVICIVITNYINLSQTDIGENGTSYFVRVP